MNFVLCALEKFSNRGDTLMNFSHIMLATLGITPLLVNLESLTAKPRSGYNPQLTWEIEFYTKPESAFFSSLSIFTHYPSGRIVKSSVVGTRVLAVL